MLLIYPLIKKPAVISLTSYLAEEIEEHSRAFSAWYGVIFFSSCKRNSVYFCFVTYTYCINLKKNNCATTCISVSSQLLQVFLK